MKSLIRGLLIFGVISSIPNSANGQGVIRPWTWAISSDFGPRDKSDGPAVAWDFHEGVDYTAGVGDSDLGTPIPAVESGNVSAIASRGLFYQIEINSTGGVWLYGHIFRNGTTTIGDWQLMFDAEHVHPTDSLIPNTFANVIVQRSGSAVVKVLSTQANRRISDGHGGFLKGADNQPILTRRFVEAQEHIAPMGDALDGNPDHLSVHLHLGLNYPFDNPMFHLQHPPDALPKVVIENPDSGPAFGPQEMATPLPVKVRVNSGGGLDLDKLDLSILMNGDPTQSIHLGNAGQSTFGFGGRPGEAIAGLGATESAGATNGVQPVGDLPGSERFIYLVDLNSINNGLPLPDGEHRIAVNCRDVNGNLGCQTNGGDTLARFITQQKPILLIDGNGKELTTTASPPDETNADWISTSTLKFSLVDPDGISRFDILHGPGPIFELVFTTQTPAGPLPAPTYAAITPDGPPIDDSRDYYIARLTDASVDENVEQVYFLLDRRGPRGNLETVTVNVRAETMSVAGSLSDEASGVASAAVQPEGQEPADYSGPVYPPGDSSRSAASSSLSSGNYVLQGRDLSGKTAGPAFLQYSVDEGVHYGDFTQSRGNAGHILKSARVNVVGYVVAQDDLVANQDSEYLTFPDHPGERPPDVGRVQVSVRSNPIPSPADFTLIGHPSTLDTVVLTSTGTMGLISETADLELAADITTEIAPLTNLAEAKGLLRTTGPDGTFQYSTITIRAGSITPIVGDVDPDPNRSAQVALTLRSAKIVGIDGMSMGYKPVSPGVNTTILIPPISIFIPNLIGRGVVGAGPVSMLPPVGFAPTSKIYDVAITAQYFGKLRLRLKHDAPYDFPSELLEAAAGKTRMWQNHNEVWKDITADYPPDGIEGETEENSLFMLAIKDGIPPVSSVNFEGPHIESSLGVPVISTRTTVILTAQDPVVGDNVDTGIRARYYSTTGVFASTSQAGVTVFEDPFTLPERLVPLAFASEDHVHNVEVTTLTVVAVDGTPPTSSLAITGPKVVEPSRIIVGPQTLFSLSSEDPISNGVSAGTAAVAALIDETVESCGLSLDEEPVIIPGAPPGSCGNPLYSVPFAVPAGTHTLGYFAIDSVLNAGVLKSTTVIGDYTLPTVVYDSIPPFTNNPQPSFRATFSDFLAGLNVSSLTISLDGNLLTEPAVTGTTLTWRTGTSLGTPVYANSLVHSGGVLYSLGGVTSAGYLTTVSYSRLTPGGVPGGWTGTTSLPQASGFMGAAALDGRIYAVGNQPGSRRVIYAQTTSNGLESQWHNGPDLPTFLFNAPLVAMAGTGRYLFVIAGQNDSNAPQKTVYRSVIDSNGVPTGWTAVTPFPDFVTAHAAASFGGRIYVLGGLSDAQSQTTPRVWSASVTANGILGQWQREPDLPIGVSGVRGTVALTASGRLYAAGGYDDRTGQYKADVWSSKPSSTGVLEAWQQETSLPEPLGFHGGAAGPVGLYIAGGATGSGATGAVRFATVAPPEGFVGTAEISASTTVTLAAELHTVVFQGADRVGNVRTSTVQFMLDLVPPTLALSVGGVSLPAGESRMVGAPLPEIVAAASDNSSGVNAASLRLFVNSASVGTPGTSDIRFTPETLSPGLNTLEARVSDNAGNAVVVTASLFFDPSPPEVALLAPLSGSVFGAGPVALEAVLRDDISGVATGSVVLSVGTTAYAATLVGGSEASSLTWRDGPSLLKAVYANSLVHSGGVIYNLGGVDSSGYLKDVTFNVLEPDGTPTQWQSTTLLPDDSGFMGAAALGGRIYAVGNQPGSRRVIYAQASSNGLEPEWHNGPLLPSPLFNAPLVAMAATGRFLFVIAGQDASNTPQSAVYRSIVDPSGTMSSWEPVNRFPVTVTAHAAASLNGRIYVLGGLSDAQSQTTPRVWSVAVDTGGNLGIWQEEPELPIGTDGVRGTVALTASGRLYALGGYDDRTGQYKAEVWSSKPEAGGGLEAWRQETSLPQPLGFHGGAAGPKGIYIAGGVVGGSGTSAVRYAQVGDGSLRATALAAGLPQATYEARASAADMAGNVTFASVAFHVDLTGPETLLVVQGASSTAPGLVLTPIASTLTLTARDLPETNNAGWAATYLAVNGAPPGPAPASFSLSTGTSLLEFWSVDTLGNVGSTQTLLVTLQDAEVVAAAVDGTAGISAPQAVVISTLAREEAPGVYQLSADSQGLVSVFNSYYELTDDIVFPLNDRAVLSFYLDLSVVTVDTTTLRIFTFEDASQTWISTSILNQRFTLLSENFGVFTGELEHTSAYALMRRTIQTDAVAPAVAFAFPRTDESGLCRLAQGPVTVRGSASDENLSSWRLTQGASLLGSGTADVQGTLGTWDATGLSGPYTLTLSAQDSAGNTATASLAVQAGPPARTLALGGKQVLSKPRGVVAGPNRIYVADTNTDAVRVFDAAGVALAVLGDKKGAAKLNKPAGIALDAAGNILVADANNKRVVKLSPAGMFVAEYGKGVLQKPVAVALSAGRLVVADAKAGQLIVFSDAGALLARVDLPQAAGPDEDPEEPRPVALAADAAGNVWAADAKGRRVLRYTPELTLAQTIPGFQRPEGVAVSPSGSCLAVSDSKAARIRTFDAALSAGLAAFGVHGEIKENKVLPAEFLLNKPAQLAFDAQGTLLVADRNNDLVQGFGLPGTPVVVAMGTPGRSGGGTHLASADGGSGDVVASARVGRFEGGRVEHPDGAAVEVPAGAISADLDVAVAKAPDSGDGHRVREAARGLAGLAAASGAREFSPHGLNFSEPALITLPYDPLLAAAPRELKIHYWNEERGAWEALASTVDEGARTVSARVAHFSVYQVLAPAGAIGVMADPDAGFAFRAIYAFPNPAVGGQRPTVHVAVGRADKVVVRFYDVAGTPVHEATLDAPLEINDESGPHLAYEYAWTGHIPSGVYLYSVTAEKAGHAPIKRVGKLAVVR